MLFNALLSLGFFVTLFVNLDLFYYPTSRSPFQSYMLYLFDMYNSSITQILTWPESMVWEILYRYVPGFRGLAFEAKVTLFLVCSALRLGVVFAWGVARLRRGKHAPYAEMLWLFASSLLVAKWTGLFFNPTIWIYANPGLLAIAGVVVFAIQRWWPPAWRRKTPE